MRPSMAPDRSTRTVTSIVCPSVSVTCFGRRQPHESADRVDVDGVPTSRKVREIEAAVDIRFDFRETVTRFGAFRYDSGLLKD